MNTQQLRLTRCWQIAVTILAVVITPAWTLAKTQTAVTISFAQLPSLAEAGEFDRLLALLKSDSRSEQDGPVASLVKDLEQYKQHAATRAAQQQEAYEKALDSMAQHAKEDQLEKALASAIDAHDLAVDPETMLNNPLVKDLITQAKTAAAAADANAEWMEAITLYRELDLLFDDFSSYREKVKRAGKHLRILRLYAPKRLKQLYEARAKRMGEDPPNPDLDTWQDKVKGIKLSMLRQTLAQAARRHVDNRGYRTLLVGAIDSLMIMIQTKGLKDTFASMGDPAKIDGFKEKLVQIRKNLNNHKRSLNFLDAATVLERVMSANNQTIDLPDQVLIYEMTEGATDTLDDFSTLIWPRDKELFSRNTQGKFYGVGIQISTRDDQLIVVSPLEDTPAQRAGIIAGDVIATVDNRDSSSWTLDRAVREITGPEGTKVTLGIKRSGKSEVLNFVLTRAEIVIESIRGWQRSPSGGWSYWIDRENGIGYIRLSQFIPQTASGLDRAINEMSEDQPLNALILDVRFNPGGLLSSAVEVSDRFISSGPIVSTVGPDGKRASQFRARRAHTHSDIPMVILVNQGSASASEILSGALQDYQRAVIVGTRSFGKGSVQDLFPLSGERAYLKLTTQYYMLPGSRIIHRKPDATSWGIEPDIEVKMTAKQMTEAIELRQQADILRSDQDSANAPDEPIVTANQILEQAKDPQLEAALLVLKTRILASQLTLAKKN